MENVSSDKAVPWEISALLTGERLKLRETERAVTPFGGLAVFVEYLNRIDLLDALKQHMPVRYRSRNQIDPSTTLICFLLSVYWPAGSLTPPGCAGTRRCTRCSASTGFPLTTRSASVLPVHDG
jgi:hypothetical protein